MRSFVRFAAPARHAARNEKFVSVVRAPSEVGARSAPAQPANQTGRLRGYRGQRPWLILVIPVVLALGAAPALAQAPSAGNQNEPKLDAGQRADAQALVSAVDEVMAGKPAPTAVSITWEQEDFIKAQGDKTYVPFTLSVDPATLKGKNVALYLRVVPSGATETPPAADEKKADEKKGDEKKKADERPQYPFEDLYFFDVGAGNDAGAPGAGAAAAAPAEQPAAPASTRSLVRRAFAVPPGDYDVYVAVKERGAPGAGSTGTSGGPSNAPAPAGQPAAPAIGVIKHPLTVKGFNTADFTTSSIIVAEKVDVLQAPLPNDRQADNPYTFGQMRIEPSLDNSFGKKSDLNIVFWIYGATPDPSTKKPDVSIDFKFYQKTADKETYFNKTDPQALNAQTLPPQFDLAAGHQLPGSLSVPLASFPEGEYRLEIDVQDKVANKTVTENVNFSVTAQ